MKNKIIEIICQSLKEIGKEDDNENLVEVDSNTRLYGGNQGNLDSLGLVRLIADLESEISDEFDKEIVLADERAMSQKISPFRRVASLADYIETLLNEDN